MIASRVNRGAVSKRNLATNPDSRSDREAQSPSAAAAAAAGTSSGISTPTPRHILTPYERFVVRITRSHRGGEVPTTMG